MARRKETDPLLAAMEEDMPMGRMTGPMQPEPTTHVTEAQGGAHSHPEYESRLEALEVALDQMGTKGKRSRKAMPSVPEATEATVAP